MFARIDENSAAPVTVLIDEEPFEAQEGDNVAAVLLLAAKVSCRRSFVSNEPRGPYCLMGVCFECLVRVDGVDGIQACMLPVRSGMRIETSNRPDRSPI